MNSEELERIEEIDEQYKIIRKDVNDIIEEIDFDTEDDKLICHSIITNMDKYMAKTFKENKCANIPYMGCVRKTIIARTINENKTNFKLAKTELTKEEYKDHVRSYIYDAKETQKKLDREKLILKKIRSKFNKKYKELYVKLGAAYADLFIKSLSWFQPIEFNQDIQDMYDKLNKEV